jgi:predicted outer membrane protein
VREASTCQLYPRSQSRKERSKIARGGPPEKFTGRRRSHVDASYDQTQLKAHQDAVALFEAYAKSGDSAELRGWAGQTLPHLKEHLSMAEKLK